jgi:hypothetical protein
MKIKIEDGPLSDEQVYELKDLLKTRQQPIDNIYDLYYKMFGFCGCGDPESQIVLLHDVLMAISDKWNVTISDTVKAKEKQDKIRALLPGALGDHYLYWLTHLDILEHGGSIGGSWLTKKGEEILLLLKTAPHGNLDPDAECNGGNSY